MIEALVSGKVLAKPTQKEGKNKKPFVLARVTAQSHTDDSVTVSVIAFNEDAQETLLKLDKGDLVSIAGKATPKLWEDPKGEKHSSLDLVANRVLTVFDATNSQKAEGANA